MVILRPRIGRESGCKVHRLVPGRGKVMKECSQRRVLSQHLLGVFLFVYGFLCHSPDAAHSLVNVFNINILRQHPETVASFPVVAFFDSLVHQTQRTGHLGAREGEAWHGVVCVLLNR